MVYTKGNRSNNDINIWFSRNTEQRMAVDFIQDITDECSTIANIQCISENAYLTTEDLRNWNGFAQGSLTSGEYKDSFSFGTIARFYAFQVIVESGKYKHTDLKTDS
jgi:hypothetical protein